VRQHPEVSGIVVIGTSAGGVQTLQALVAQLPADLAVPVLVVLHLPPQGVSVLPAILSRAGDLPARHPEQGEKLQPGIVYVAPPDRHLLVDGDHIELSGGPRENGARPSIDAMFRSVARAFGPSVVAVVLSGMLDDGTAGLHAVKKAGGVCIVQDPDDALFPAMPASALQAVNVDAVAGIDKIPRLIVEAVKNLPRISSLEAGPAPDPPMAAGLGAGEDDQMGEITPFSCPECGGTLWEHASGRVSHFRCRIGHAYSPDSLYAKQGERLDEALWAAIVALEERADLADRMAKRMTTSGRAALAVSYENDADDARRRADLVRRVVVDITSRRPIS